MQDRLDRYGDLGLAGIVLALIGGLLGLVQYLESLVAAGPGWPEALVMGLVSGLVIVGVAVMVRGRGIEGGLLATVAGVVLAVQGPPAAGVLAVIGGVLMFVAARGSPTIRVGSSRDA